jgi:Tol biopolymer transport system component
LYYGRGSGSEKKQWVWRDRAGKQLEVVGQPVDLQPGYSLSPDGSRVAYTAWSSGGWLDVWVLELGRGLSTRITFNGGRNPQWSPDGKQLYYLNGKGIQRKAADGSGGEELLLQASGFNFPSSVSPDGKVLLYGSGDIKKLSLSGERKSEAYLETKYSEGNAVFSPDGRWVAYNSNESGRSEIYVEGYPERRGKWLVSAEGGMFPQWRGDGKELYWSKPDGTLMAASMVLQAGGVQVGRAEALFRGTGLFGYFQSANDGKRFLIAEQEGGEQAFPMVVQLNYAARLQ